MISRRNFLRYTGLAIAAASAGYTTGKLTGTSDKSYFALQGFLPEEEKIIAGLFNVLKKNVSSRYEPSIYTSGVNAEKIKQLVSTGLKKEGNGRIVIRVNRLDNKVPSDLLLSDGNNFIHNPDTDYTMAFYSFRDQVRNKPADLFFSVEWSEKDLFASIFNNKSRTAVLQNEKGIVEKLDLDKDYSDIIINGASGNTSFKIKNGTIQVSNSCCRNKICSHSGHISQPGSIIACAPNKVLVRIENA